MQQCLFAEQSLCAQLWWYFEKASGSKIRLMFFDAVFLFIGGYTIICKALKQKFIVSCHWSTKHAKSLKGLRFGSCKAQSCYLTGWEWASLGTKLSCLLSVHCLHGFVLLALAFQGSASLCSWREAPCWICRVDSGALRFQWNLWWGRDSVIAETAPQINLFFSCRYSL